MGRASVTIEDVAKASGVSRQTVSRVINEATNVSAFAREKVQSAISELSYVPNLAARRMGGARSYAIVALMAGEAGRGEGRHLPLGDMLTAGVEACGKSGYHLIFEQIDAGDEATCAARLAPVLGALQPDGVVVIPPLDDNAGLRSALKARGVPVAFLGERTEFGRTVPGLDEEAFAERAAKRLIGLGHRQVGFVAGSGNLDRSKRRLEGYRRALARASSRAHRHFVASEPADFRGALKLARDWLTPTIRPTAVLTETPEVALAFHQITAELGIIVPRDLSLLSLADASALSRAKPAIAALNLPYDTLFAQACRRLKDRKMRNGWKMDEMQQLLDQQLAKAVSELGLDEDDFERVASDTFNEVLGEVEATFEEDLRAREQEMLQQRRSDHVGFVGRNVDRWRAGFDKLERLIVMSEEVGGAIAFALGEAAAQENDPLYEATISLHSRAVLISREVLCLMVNGFPDGAMGRWRTLHEVGVTAQFIGHHGRETAERFLAHRHWLANERAKQFQRYSERAGLRPLDAETVERLGQTACAVSKRYGEEIESDYGWAYPVLNNRRPKLIHLEENLGLDHWRPRYRWASMATHSPYMTPLEGLGMSESSQPVRLVGPSNSGMTDPAQMAAMTLNLATVPVVMLHPNLDRLAVMRIMLRLSDEIGDTFFETQLQTLATAQGTNEE